MHQKIGGSPEHSVLDFNVIYVHRVQVKFPNSFKPFFLDFLLVRECKTMKTGHNIFITIDRRKKSYPNK